MTPQRILLIAIKTQCYPSPRRSCAVTRVLFFVAAIAVMATIAAIPAVWVIRLVAAGAAVDITYHCCRSIRQSFPLAVITIAAIAAVSIVAVVAGGGAP